MGIRPVCIGFLPLEDNFLQFFWEPPNGLAQVAFKKADNRLRIGKGFTFFKDILGGQPVADEVLCHIANYLGAGGYLYNIAEKIVYICIHGCDLRKLMFQAKGNGLPLKVGVLPPGNLMFVHFPCSGLKARFEGVIIAAHCFPIVGVLCQFIAV